MGKLLFIAFCTVLFAAIGFTIGEMLDEGTTRTVTATCAGAAGGFGIACAAAHVLRRWQAQYRRA